MKTQKIWLLVALLIGSLQLQAQNIEQIFQQIPPQVQPNLNQRIISEMLEYYKVSKDSLLTTTAKNLMRKPVKIIAIDSLHQNLKAEIATDVTLELQQLPLSDSTYILAAIRTISTDDSIRNSMISFYDKHWTKIYNYALPPDALTDWIVSQEAECEGRKIAELIPIQFTEIIFLPQKKVLKLTNNSLRYLNTEQCESIPESVIPTKYFRWNGNGWEKIAELHREK